jgi:hypothetical protein
MLVPAPVLAENLHSKVNKADDNISDFKSDGTKRKRRAKN